MQAASVGLAAGLAVGAALLGGCGTSDSGTTDSEGCGLLPASAQIGGHLYDADSRYGRPVSLGQELPESIRLAACDESSREVPGFAIDGIPTTVAIYAPDAYGEEFILVNADADWKPTYRQHLTVKGAP
jgi:hypothetical protein